MALPKCEFNQIPDYDITTNNCIGPCADTSIRSGFDCGSGGGFTYNDTNTRFVKKTGDDTTGLYGHEFTTIEGAVAQAITDGVNNVAVLDSEIYEEIITSEIPASFKIVAEDGMIPTIKWVGDDPANPSSIVGNVVQASEDNIMTIFSNNPQVSDDKGRSWTAKALPAGNASFIAPGLDGRVFVANNASTIYYTDDSGDSYSVSITGLPANAGDIIYDELSLIYAISNTRLYYSGDNGENWLYNDLGDVYAIIGVGNNGRLFLTNDNVNIYYTDNKGQTINGISATYLYEIKKLANTILVSYGWNGVYYSDDNGISWESIDLPTGYSLFGSVGGLRAIRDYIYITTGGEFFTGRSFVSKDLGISWVLITEYDNDSPLLKGIEQNILFTNEEYTPLEIISQLNNTLEINGFYLDGNNKQALGLISGTGSQTNLTLEYCELSDYYYKAVYNVDFATLTAQYCKITGGEHGIVPD